MSAALSHAVRLDNVGKRFTKYVDTPMLLSSALRFRPSTRREKLWAVRGVDLEIEEGESFGVIGQNGSGKTTLMSLMAGITAPSEGSVQVYGRVAPLISVGVGFHRELTGRENIYVNGAMLGMTRQQVNARLEEIIDFAEVGAFIDTPVKFYSSGMFVRLGFAVAAHCDPQVLIVDEVLAVGDLAFQLKCFERMNEIRNAGTTVVMVSHHLGVVRRMCQRVLLMHAGKPAFLGATEEAIGAFHQLMNTAQELQVDDSSGMRFEPQVVAVDSVELAQTDGTTTSHFDVGSEIVVNVAARALEDVEDLVMALTVSAADGTVIYADSSAGTTFGAVGRDETCHCTVAFRCQLPTGSYQATVRVDRDDLRTTLAHHPPVSFFVTGRHTVAGVADLGCRFVRHDPEPHQAVLVGSEEGR